MCLPFLHHSVSIFIPDFFCCRCFSFSIYKTNKLFFIKFKFYKSTDSMISHTTLCHIYCNFEDMGMATSTGTSTPTDTSTGTATSTCTRRSSSRCPTAGRNNKAAEATEEAEAAVGASAAHRPAVAVVTSRLPWIHSRSRSSSL